MKLEAASFASTLSCLPEIAAGAERHDEGELEMSHGRLFVLAALVATTAQAQTPVERGRYLVDTIHDLPQLPHADGDEWAAIRQGAVGRTALQ
jgi:hypothetical protein